MIRKIFTRHAFVICITEKVVDRLQANRIVRFEFENRERVDLILAFPIKQQLFRSHMKPQTNYWHSFRFSFLAPDWLFRWNNNISWIFLTSSRFSDFHSTKHISTYRKFSHSFPTQVGDKQFKTNILGPWTLFPTFHLQFKSKKECVICWVSKCSISGCVRI